ncbi:DUF6653 family protein [Halobellus limi]|uniref:Uncharacterized protein n=1 Tax=Halobellus limi TaxID=699433 RepID=A0A1H6CKY7_9EURY|nr:DUF6653 family protein [Halobellus limi]QCC46199.1 hypothetical protein DV707_00015 [Halobellus limi]SEG73373.1 hypothetical protein SAMN04488133_3494 [Halobellus limi]
MSLRERTETTLWSRHSNPKSGWTRVPTGPVVVYALYHRKWRLLTAALVWTVLNPVLFDPPETDDAWMTRAVLAEQWWIREEGRATVGLGYPNVCNAVGALGFCYALYAAYRQRPVGATVGTVASLGLKLWWLRVLVRRYDAATARGESDGRD